MARGNRTVTGWRWEKKSKGRERTLSPRIQEQRIRFFMVGIGVAEAVAEVFLIAEAAVDDAVAKEKEVGCERNGPGAGYCCREERRG